MTASSTRAQQIVELDQEFTEFRARMAAKLAPGRSRTTMLTALDRAAEAATVAVAQHGLVEPESLLGTDSAQDPDEGGPVA